MTRQDAVRQVVKLRALAAQLPPTPESEAADKAARNLAQEFSLGEQELTSAKLAALFDDLSSRIEIRARRGGLPGIVTSTLAKLKNIAEPDKASAVAKIKDSLALAVLIFGSGGACGELQQIFESACKAHDVAID